MKKVILYQNFYIDSGAERQKEIMECLRRNINCDKIDEIVLLCEEGSFGIIPESKKLTLLILNKRPTYNDFFSIIKDEDAIHIVANTDIYFTDTLQLIKMRGVKDRECFALSRYDLLPNKSLVPHLCRGSQDAWIFSKPPQKLDGADFTLGVPGCDNKIALLIQRSGYKVTNPSKDIHCIHMHTTGKRNYSKDKDRIPPPYYLVYPTTLAQA